MKKRETKFFALKFKKPKIIDDVLYPQLRKLCKRLETILKEHEFSPLRVFYHVDNYIYLIIELGVWTLPSIKQMFGPPVYASKNVCDFVKKYADTFLFFKDSNICTERKREYKEALELMKDFLRKNEEDLKSVGVPKKLIPSLKTSKILEHERFWKEIETNKLLGQRIKEIYFELPKLYSWYVTK